MMPSLPKGIAALIAVVGLCFGCIATRAVALTPNQVLLVYNSLNAESNEIATYYLLQRPGVESLDLAIDYSLYPACAVPPCGPSDPPDSGFTAITSRYITRKGFIDLVRGPVLAKLAQKPDVVAIVTTRGLPSAISNDFTPFPASLSTAMRSFEGQLSRIGNTTTAESSLTHEDNPFYQNQGVGFDGWIQNPSCVLSAAAAGKIYSVTRLDSNFTNGTTAVAFVKQLIDRSLALSVNKYSVTLVADHVAAVPGAFCPASITWSLALIRGQLCDAGWCVWIDNTSSFLHGKYTPVGQSCSSFTCGSAGPVGSPYPAEAPYIDYRELVHVGYGHNHGTIACPTLGGTEAICSDYARYYWAHPAGLFDSQESYNGWSSHAGTTVSGGCIGQGSALDWIISGGSFTFMNVDEPSTSYNADPPSAIINLYVHGLSWADASMSAFPQLGRHSTAIGDPLATVKVMNPDLDGDKIITALDLGLAATTDVDGDGTPGTAADIAVVTSVLGRDCTLPSCTSDVVPQPQCGIGIGGYYVCRGDVNSDHRVDTADADLVNDHSGCQCSNLDTAQDGPLVTNADLAYVLDHLNTTFVDWADVNGDSVVSCADLVAYDDCVSTPSCDLSPFDIDCDGELTDVFDRNIILGALGSHAAAAAAPLDSVDCADVLAVFRCAAGCGPCNLATMDIDCSGTVDFFDFLGVRDYVDWYVDPLFTCPEDCP